MQLDNEQGLPAYVESNKTAEYQQELAYVYFLDLVQLTLCKEDFDLERESKRELTELIPLALLYVNTDYMNSFVIMSDLMNTLDLTDTIDQATFEKTFLTPEATCVLEPDIIEFNYHEVTRILKNLFGRTLDKQRVRTALNLCVSWKWLEYITINKTYSLPTTHLRNSAVLKRLVFDESLVDEVMNPENMEMETPDE